MGGVERDTRGMGGGVDEHRTGRRADDCERCAPARQLTAQDVAAYTWPDPGQRSPSAAPSRGSGRACTGRGRGKSQSEKQHPRRSEMTDPQARLIAAAAIRFVKARADLQQSEQLGQYQTSRTHRAAL